MKFNTNLLIKGKSVRIPVAIAQANNFITRAIGLLATKELLDGQGLLIVPCKDVHTWFMRFSIDVVFLGKNNEVLAIRDSVKPFRFVLGPKGTVSVLELASGIAVRAGIEQGDHLSF